MNLMSIKEYAEKQSVIATSIIFEDKIVQEDSIKNEAQLVKKVENGFKGAFNKFLSKHRVKTSVKESGVTKTRMGDYLIQFETTELTGNDLGFLQYAFTHANIGSFSGGKIRIVEDENSNDFKFHRFIWFAPSVRWESHGGGTNGTGFRVDPKESNDYWYDIIDEVVLTRSEAIQAGA